MVSITLNRNNLTFPVEQRYKYQLDLLYQRADEKSKGYITMTLSLPKKNGTDSQSRTFHALLNEYYISGLHSYASYEDMRDSFKLKAGGAKEYVYLKDGKQHTCKKLDDIPRSCQFIGIPKSWLDLIREERATAIKLLIAEGYEAGMNSNHWEEIISGMEVN